MGLAWVIAAAVLTAANSVTSSVLAAKQYELARQYFQIARNWQDWYNEAFVPLENAELDEINNTKAPTPYYDTAIGRARNLGLLANRAKLETTLKCTSQYDTGLRSVAVRNHAAQLNHILGVSSSMGYRNERARIEALEDLRWARIIQVISRGRNIAASHAQYGRLAANIYGSLQAQVNTAITGMVQNGIGYGLNRLETQYPMRNLFGRWSSAGSAESGAAPVTDSSRTGGGYGI
jgi:hypothetical protein